MCMLVHALLPGPTKIPLIPTILKARYLCIYYHIFLRSYVHAKASDVRSESRYGTEYTFRACNYFRDELTQLLHCRQTARTNRMVVWYIDYFLDLGDIPLKGEDGPKGSSSGL